MNTIIARIKEVKYPIITGIISLINALPYRTALAIGRFFGLLGWIVDPFHRRVADVQMRSTLGPAYNRFLSLKVFMHHGDILVDTIRYAYMDDEEIKKKIVVEGKENLDAALATKKGLMLFTGHIGNWEILSHVSRLLDIQFCVMAEVRNDAKLEAIIDDIRSRSGATILPPKGKALMLIKELRKGRTIGMIIDQRGGRSENLYCDMLGLPAPTNPAPAFIALKGNALIMPVHTIKQGDTYRIYFSPALDAHAFGEDKAAIQSLSDFMQSWVSSIVRQYPDQWFWLHCRWTRRSEMRKILKTGEDFRELVLSQAQNVQQIS